jgi:hypothetical protein
MQERRGARTKRLKIRLDSTTVVDDREASE